MRDDRRYLCEVDCPRHDGANQETHCVRHGLRLNLYAGIMKHVGQEYLYQCRGNEMFASRGKGVGEGGACKFDRCRMLDGEWCWWGGGWRGEVQNRNGASGSVNACVHTLLVELHKYSLM